ncbi:MAG TPA: phosphoribosylanthranilate isomerase [Methylomirabilota bacterium]|nr:phosphoribosylanthranilate isomerase [Methylomirabilota bacterium]
MIRVKICGITNAEDAMTAVEASADALGFIFVENTPRYVTPEQVAAIIGRLPPFVTPVGVFWDHPRGHVKAVAETCGLRALQFHGDETPEDVAGYDLPVIKTVKLPPVSTIEGLREYRVGDWAQVLRYSPVSSAVLLDTAARWSEGEAREPLEWQTVRWLQSGTGRRFRLILSGGLTPDNVARAVIVAQPYAVDVNSGVEARPGKKDPDKVRRFVAEARRAG